MTIALRIGYIFRSLVHSTMETYTYCIVCHRLIRPRQESVECETCNRRQHRTCGTGIARDQYRLALKGIVLIELNEL